MNVTSVLLAVFMVMLVLVLRVESCRKSVRRQVLRQHGCRPKPIPLVLCEGECQDAIPTTNPFIRSHYETCSVSESKSRQVRLTCFTGQRVRHLSVSVPKACSCMRDTVVSQRQHRNGGHSGRHSQHHTRRDHHRNNLLRHSRGQSWILTSSWKLVTLESHGKRYSQVAASLCSSLLYVTWVYLLTCLRFKIDDAQSSRKFATISIVVTCTITKQFPYLDSQIRKVVGDNATLIHTASKQNWTLVFFFKTNAMRMNTQWSSFYMGFE